MKKMLRSKKILSIITVTLLVISLGTIIPVKADTDIFVATTGDVQVVINTDGTVNLIYNGVNIQAEINGLKAVLCSITYQMSQLATKTEVSNLNQTVYKLIGELDTILEDLYGKTTFLAYAIGLNSNSTVGTNLMSGNYTIASYLESIIGTLDNVVEDMIVIENAINTIYGRLNELEVFKEYALEQFNVTYLEIENLGNYTERQFNATYLEINNLANYTDTQLESLGNYTDRQLDALYIELNGNLQDLETSTLQLMNATNYEIREDFLSDLITLQTSIKAGENRQDFTEAQVQNLQQRLYDVENVLGAFVLISIVLTIILVAVGIKRKLSKPKPLQ